MLGFLVCFNLLRFCISIILLDLIQRYIQKKPPGLQSVLDLLMLDGIKVWIVKDIFGTILDLVGIFHGNIDPLAAEIMIQIMTFLLVISVAAVQVILVVKILLIFQPGIFVDLPDSKVIWMSRTATLIYPLLKVVLDCLIPLSTELTLMEFLTGNVVKS